MEELKELVKKYYEFVTNVLVTESELFDNYFEKMSNYDKDYYNNKEILDKMLIKNIYADILYDFVFDIKNIEKDLINATDFFEENEENYEEQETIKIYKEIKKLFPTFVIKEIEKEV